MNRFSNHQRLPNSKFGRNGIEPLGAVKIIVLAGIENIKTGDIGHQGQTEG